MACLSDLQMWVTGVYMNAKAIDIFVSSRMAVIIAGSSLFGCAVWIPTLSHLIEHVSCMWLYWQAGQNMLIQSGPESTDGDALLAIATQSILPKHMHLGLIQMKDQERMDRYS